MPKNNKTFERALSYCWRLLNIRERSEKELKDKLKKKNYSLDISDNIINHLKKAGLLNDAHFARAWVNTRMALKPSGLFRLRYELKEKGISPQLIEETLDDLKKRYNLQEIALGLAKKKINSSKFKDEKNMKPRVYNYLKRRGFSAEIIFLCMNALFKDVNAEDK